MRVGIWLVSQAERRWIIDAKDQWEAWEQIFRGSPQEMTIIVSALECVPGYTEGDIIAVRGVDLLLRWGEYKLAKQLDAVAVEYGLPSTLGKEAYQRLQEIEKGGERDEP